MLNTEIIQWRSTDEKPTSDYILVKFKGGNVEMVNYADNLVKGSKIVRGNFGWTGGSDYCGMSSVEKWALLPNGD